MSAPESRALAATFAFGAILSIQVGAAVATSLFSEVGPAGTVFLRLAFATLILIAIFRPGLDLLRGSSARVILLFGVALAGMNFCFYEAIDRIPLGVAVACELVGPLAVAVAGSRRPRDLAFVAVAALGIFLLTGPLGGSPDALGIGLALLAGCFWGIYILVGARMGREVPVGSGLAVAMGVAALLGTVPGVASGGRGLLEPSVLAIGLVVGLMSSAVPYSLELRALRSLPTRTFGVMMSLEPAVAAGVGLAVLGQGLTFGEAAGIACVVLASAGALAESGAPAPVEP